jgi:hypothetical protein
MDRLRKIGGSSAFGPLFVFVVWTGFLVCVVYLASAPVNAPLSWDRALSNWDTGWYLSIIETGYHRELGAQSNVAFFPVYPLLVRWISSLGPEPVAAGVGLSLACFLAALFVLRRLLLTRLEPRAASNALLLTAFWPFSFFFGLAYTESLFLLLAAASFMFAHEERWWPAALCAGVASATRVVGVFVAVGIVLAFLQKDEWRPTPRYLMKSAALGIVGASGLLAFMAYLARHTGSALAFLEVQSFWPDRGQGVAGLKRVPEILTSQASSVEYATLLVFLIPLVLFLGLSIYVLLRLDSAWGAFCLMTLLAPLLTGSIASTNRYVLVLFPCFAAVAELLKDRAAVVVAASAGLLGVFAYHYVFHAEIFIG